MLAIEFVSERSLIFIGAGYSKIQGISLAWYNPIKRQGLNALGLLDDSEF